MIENNAVFCAFEKARCKQKRYLAYNTTYSKNITSPLVNEVAVAMFLGAFGWQTTMIYVVSGIVLGCLGGIVLGQMHLEPYLSDWVKQVQSQSDQQSAEWEKDDTAFSRRLPIIIRDAWQIVRNVLLYVLIGIGIGAFMHGFVPEGFFNVKITTISLIVASGYIVIRYFNSIFRQ